MSSDILPVAGSFFLVEITGNPIGRFSSCTGLSVEVETMEYAEGGNNSFVHVFPTRRRYPPLVLSRGLTDQTGLIKWFTSVYDQQQGQTEITISMMNQSGQAVVKFSAANAYPTAWSGPDLDAANQTVASESLTIVHQGLKVA